MHIKRLCLNNFRNFPSFGAEFREGLNVIHGENGRGKTNLLESVYFCANGRSIRAKSDKELIAFGEKDAHIQAFIERRGIVDRIDAHLRADGVKSVSINGLPVKRLGDLLRDIFVVIFSPEDLSLLKGGPAERRRFMDIQLCRLSPVYYYDLQQYYKILKQRNLLLKDIQKSKDGRETLFVWDEQLAGYGARIIAARDGFIEKLRPLARSMHGDVSGGREELSVIYQPNIAVNIFLAKLQKSADRDIYTGATQTGPHKDELLFEINGRDARLYASQGQQRTACLSAVLAEAALISDERGESPILLLDDVFSELDESRRLGLTNMLGSMQTLISCAGSDKTVDTLKALGAMVMEM